MSRLIDETGNRYGKIVVIRRSPIPAGNKSVKTYWLCQCDCGNIHSVNGAALRNGSVRSCGCLVRLKHGESSFNSVIRVMKKSAKQRGHEWKLNRKQVRFLIKESCYYCGIEPSQVVRGANGDCVHGGIDRLDNDKGYVIGNVVPCCSSCNTAKYRKSLDEFRKWVRDIYDGFIIGNAEIDLGELEANLRALQK